MVKSAFHEFTAFRVHHRNLLEARMKIYPYNQHTRLLSSRVLVSYALPSLLGLGEEPTLLSNQLHQLHVGAVFDRDPDLFVWHPSFKLLFTDCCHEFRRTAFSVAQIFSLCVRTPVTSAEVTPHILH